MNAKYFCSGWFFSTFGLSLIYVLYNMSLDFAVVYVIYYLTGLFCLSTTSYPHVILMRTCYLLFAIPNR